MLKVTVGVVSARVLNQSADGAVVNIVRAANHKAQLIDNVFAAKSEVTLLFIPHLPDAVLESSIKVNQLSFVKDISITA